MDGNRRWARMQRLLNNEGHSSGLDKMNKFILAMYHSNFQIDKLVFWCLSYKNYKSRSETEIKYLFDLFRTTFKDDVNTWLNLNYKIYFIGDYDSVDKDILDMISSIHEQSDQKVNSKMTI
mmetsp:Transcript_67066/g.56940  ORF Transcript_67066/g.56940 Transcript_67066/m.56940 type:complete len:121 (+) Transcript_67066:51-413(+)